MEKKKLGPDHFRYVDDIGPDGLEIQCITYQVIGETAQCWYIADDYTVNMINGYQHSWTAEAVKKRRKRVSKDPGGKRFAYREIPVVVTYHPAYLLRSLPEKAKAWEDLLFARRLLRAGQEPELSL